LKIKEQETRLTLHERDDDDEDDDDDLIKCTISGTKVTEHNMRVLIFSINFI
jgi:hypothetical protein